MLGRTGLLLWQDGLISFSTLGISIAQQLYGLIEM
jgi:hypothetical protein